MSERWFGDGLRFECTRCGNCCTGASGAVRVSEREVAVLASRSGLTASEFRQAYTRALPGGAISLRETSRGACVFFVAGQGCSVYEDRPRQCRTWPFWKQVVETRESWNREAVECPGMNHGPLHAATEIIATSERDGTSRDSGERS